MKNWNRKKKRKRKKKKIRQENERKWFEDLIGKYVSVNHNDVSFTVFYVDKNLQYHLLTDFEVFNIYRAKQDGQFSIQKERRGINKYWIDNPYIIRSYGEKANMKIITKEEYNKIEELYKTYSAKLKELNI